MLRAAPSCIGLTSVDVSDFDKRFTARHARPLARIEAPSVRLSPGPGHQTRFAFIPKDNNAGRTRAVSCSSEAMIYAVDDDPSHAVSTSPCREVTTSSSFIESGSSPDQSKISNETGQTLKSDTWQLQSPPRRPSNGQLGSSNFALPSDNSVAQPSPRTMVGGTNERQPAQLLASEQSFSSPSARNLNEDVKDTWSTISSRHTSSRAFSSARARRRGNVSHEQRSFPDLPESRQYVGPQIGSSTQRHEGDVLAVDPMIPELVFPDFDDIMRPARSMTLDPGAPVFIPRTRFGSTAGSSVGDGIVLTGLEPQWNSLDSTHGSSNLRIRPSSQQNVELLTRRRLEPDSVPPERVRRRERRRSGTSDQNTALHQPPPNVERYPVLRPHSRPSVQHRSNASHRPVLLLGRRVSRLTLTAPPQSRRNVATDIGRSRGEDGRAFSLHFDDSAGVIESHRVESPYSFVDGRSSPDLLQQSLRVDHQNEPDVRFSRLEAVMTASYVVPSALNATIGVSNVLEAGRFPSAERLNATADFLRMGPSPLDDLTERLSRFSSNRPRSVGRSWERSQTRRARVSLLTGDPFRQEPSSALLRSPGVAVTTSSQEQIAEESSQNEDPQSDMGSPSRFSSTLLSASVSPPSERNIVAPLSSTPPVYNAGLSSPQRLPLTDRSPGKFLVSPGSAIKRRPVPTATTTPRVPVYNDADPPHTQPQTPADIEGIVRRTRGRSHADHTSRPENIGEIAAMTSPPATGTRYPHRNSYASTASPQPRAPSPGQVDNLRSSGGFLSRAIPLHGRRRRAGTHGSSELAENDVHAHTNDLERDRRIWRARQENGSLDTTPPREGRYERYLS